jgi:hypothetical protein
LAGNRTPRRSHSTARRSTRPRACGGASARPARADGPGGADRHFADEGFDAWRSLAHAGLEDDEIVELMVALVRAAGEPRGKLPG